MEEANFPRGGHSIQEEKSAENDASPKRWQQKKNQNDKSSSKKRAAESDFLFGDKRASSKDASSGKKKKKKKAKTVAPDEALGNSKSMLPVGGGCVIHPSSSSGSPNKRRESWMEGVAFSKLSAGFKLLAVCREVHEDVAIFSLPNQWTAYCQRHSNKTGEGIPCTDQLQEGQVLAVSIVKVIESQNHQQKNSSAAHRGRRIQVTCLPAVLNPSDLLQTSAKAGQTLRGQVLSVEDHGLLIDLGLGRRGFLPFDEIHIDSYYCERDADEEEDEGLQDDGKKKRQWLGVGRILDLVITKTTAVKSRDGDDSSSISRIVPLSLLSHKKMATHTLPVSCGTPTLQNLMPGMLVQCYTEKVISNGLCVSFCSGIYRGAIHSDHLGGYWKSADKNEEKNSWKNLFEEHRSFQARIIAVDAGATKIVRLSLARPVMELQHHHQVVSMVGKVYEDASVIRLDAGVGALLALPQTEEQDEVDDENPFKKTHKPFHNRALWKTASYQAAASVQACYVHISKAMDNHEKLESSEFAKHFSTKSKHTVRILNSNNLMDGNMVSGATAPSIVTAHVLTYGDVQPANVYKKVPVLSYLDGGSVLVDLGLGIRGLIPKEHLFESGVEHSSADYRKAVAKAKFTVGSKVDAVRVLQVDPETKRCILTTKKSLVQAKHVLSSFEDVNVGDRATGFITQVSDRGLSVTFFNGVYGRVTARSLQRELGVDDIRENYNVGDVVTCRVVHIKTKKTDGRGQIVHENISSKYHPTGGDDPMDIDNGVSFRELTLSLKTTSLLKADDANQNEVAHLTAGTILPSRSLRVVQLQPGRSRANGSYVPGYAVCSIKRKYLLPAVEGKDAHTKDYEDEYMDCKLPFDQLLDEYDAVDLESAAALDAAAEKLLTVGKKVNRVGMILEDPAKTLAEYEAGTGRLPVTTIRPMWVETAMKLQEKENSSADEGSDDEKDNSTDKEGGSTQLLLPGCTNQHLFVGCSVQGYVTQVHPKHGAFVRFLSGLTGLVPKTNGGLEFSQYKTVTVQIAALDITVNPMKILLSPIKTRKRKRKADTSDGQALQEMSLPFNVDDIIKKAVVEKLDFNYAYVRILSSEDDSNDENKLQYRLHVTMTDKVSGNEQKEDTSAVAEITQIHPFYGWTIGMQLKKLRVLSVGYRGGVVTFELTNRQKQTASDSKQETEDSPEILKSASQLVPGQTVEGIVSSIPSGGSKGLGLRLALSPGVDGFVPALEVSTDISVLNNLEKHYPLGSRLRCRVLDSTVLQSVRDQYFRLGGDKGDDSKDDTKTQCGRQQQQQGRVASLTLLSCESTKPQPGDLVLGCINRHVQMKEINHPSLMLDLKGGHVARCCITELQDSNHWVDAPLKKQQLNERNKATLRYVHAILIKMNITAQMERSHRHFIPMWDCDLMRAEKKMAVLCGATP